MKIEREHLLKPIAALAASHPLRVLLVSRNQTSQLELQAELAHLQGVSVEPVAGVGSIPAILDSRQGSLIVLVDSNPEDAQDLELIQDLRRMGGGDLTIVALVDRGSATAPLRAIRAGANDVLLKPIDLPEAQEVLARFAEQSRPAAEKPVIEGKVIAFMHFAGGAGATTLAVNSAIALSRAAKNPDVCLVDMDLQFGNAANLLDLTSASPVQDLIEDPRRLDDQMLDSMMLRHASGLRVLTAPGELLPLTLHGEGSVASIMALARRRYEFVIVDMPAALSSWTDTVLRVASVIYIVTPLTVPAAHRLCKFLHLLRSDNISGLPLKIVANRHQRNSKNTNDVTVPQFEKATGVKIDYLVPNDYSLISMSHGQGEPAVKLKPSSPFAEALKSMLAAELGKDLFTAPRRGFFSRGG